MDWSWVVVVDGREEGRIDVMENCKHEDELRDSLCMDRLLVPVALRPNGCNL
jgi:hypothetical protein